MIALRSGEGERMKWTIASVAVACACASSVLAVAQTAHQGVQNDGERFASPMVLETPLATFDEAASRLPGWRVLAETTRLSRFLCEGISVPLLSAKASEKIDKEGMQSLEIALTLASVRHEDKDVDLLIELVRDGQVLAHTHLPAVEVEERSRTSRQVRWKVASREIASKPASLIRVTVAVPGIDSAASRPAVVPAAPLGPSPSPATSTEEPGAQSPPPPMASAAR
jgi:hypothetical protein